MVFHQSWYTDSTPYYGLPGPVGSVPAYLSNLISTPSFLFNAPQPPWTSRYPDVTHAHLYALGILFHIPLCLGNPWSFFFFQSCLKYNFLAEAFLEPLNGNQFSLGRQSFLGPCVPNCRPFFHPLFHPGHFSGLFMQLVILRGNIVMTIQEKSRLPYYFLEKAVGLWPCSSHLQDTSSRYGASIWTTTSPPGTWNNTTLLIIMLFNGPWVISCFALNH